MKKAQLWSLDSIIATIVFISAITAFILVLSSNYSFYGIEEIKYESEVVPQKLLTSENTEISILTDNLVDLEKLKTLQEYEYEELKSLLGVQGDFCIFFENSDGEVVNLSQMTGAVGNSMGLGSNKINISDGVACFK